MQAGANCADPDQTPQNAASDQGLHCLSTTLFAQACLSVWILGAKKVAQDEETGPTEKQYFLAQK